MIIFQQVSKTYKNGTQALRHVNITIPTGDFLYLVGVSGAGKSTFGRLITREEKVTKGKLLVFGEDVASMNNRQLAMHRRKIGTVFQNHRLFPTKTVYENVAFAMEAVGFRAKDAHPHVLQALNRVGLTNKSEIYPLELSGGEQQRVAIARAVVNKPNILIADEPTGNLDDETAWEIMRLFYDINQEGTTVIMATHNRNIVENFVNRVVVIERGTIIEDGGRVYEQTFA
ncbi:MULTISPECIES: cell division ATP-binding protein FtsE [Pseudobacillus]|uniref:cell division ATP-binding protein FtsE n=1 Tax=Pseudobacillus TaxID=108525 RepID=UPI00387A0E22